MCKIVQNSAMEAPKCRTCGDRHWGRMCPKSSSGSRESRPAIKKPSGLSVPDRPLTQPMAPGVGVAPNPLEAKPKRGRPLNKDRATAIEATKPWIGEGVSRRTWYARKKAKGAKP